MLLALLLSLTPAAPQQTFLTREIKVGLDPAGLALIDLDGDGLLDFVTVDFGGNSVSAVRQLPGRVLSPAVSSQIDGERPDLIAGGDFDGDGLGDIALGFENSRRLAVLLGDGTGRFTEIQRLDLAGYSYDLVAHDFDRDGSLDLATSVWGPAQVKVFDGVGDGTFASPVGHVTSGLPTWLSVGDLNGDGFDDLVSATCSANSQNVIEGTLAGPLGNISYIDMFGEQFWNEIADVNGDGKLDMFSADFESELWLQIDYPVFDWPFGHFSHGHYHVVTGDLNGDGFVDLISSAGNSLRYSYGDGGIAWPVNEFAPACSYGALAPAVGDFDGDGREDLATYCDEEDLLSVLFNLPDGEPAVEKLTPRELPSLLGTGEVLRVTGYHFDQLSAVRLGSTALDLHAGSAPDDLINTAVIVSPNEMHIVPEALSLQTGELQLTLLGAQGSTAFRVPVTAPTAPILQTFDGDLTFTAGVDDLSLYLGAPAGSLVGLASSPDLIPTPLPGLVDLAIGNGGASLTTQAWLVLGDSGWTSLLFGTLPEFAGLTVHLQSIALDPGDPLQPIAPSAPLSITFQ